MVAFIADESKDDVLIPAISLGMCGVRTLVVGMGNTVQHSQLTDIAYPPSYVLRTDSIDGVSKSDQAVAALLSQGKPVLFEQLKIYISNFSPSL